VQSRDALETKLYAWGEEVASNAIEVHIHNLRKKLPPESIKTVRGVGYVVEQA
jgi:DNA-binding response OmpR family regulator